ncbi:CG10979 [Drosophila busckii]|uniref:CG10979 n=1 Tax=Drosophila busckii TaxID=30019 RepID=A0A0M4EN93_DROBS|nr:zinc finger protein 800 [Drosophila busckii]ALC46114.1 CG10979 [Drosophila busckii]
MDNDENDLSLLQRPLQTAHTGFEEARRAYEDGTSEVRRLLGEECSLIYECNVCRNMFRSLANFISHKRVFCCISSRASRPNHNTGYTDQNSTRIIQAGNSQDFEHMLRSRSTGCSPVPREGRSIRGSMRDISGVIERLRREKAPTAAAAAGKQPVSPVLQLESVPSSSQAVYQTIKLEQDDSIKTELNEVHHMLNAGQAIVGPDGKPVSSQLYERPGGSDSAETPEQSVSDETETNIFCEICNSTFQTQKTLELHIQKHHSSSAFVFQCPACSLTFLQAAAVIRHLSKDHKKPTRRIRMMRNTILKRRKQQGDVQPKGPSRELKRLQLSDDVVHQVPERRDDNGEQRKIMSLCIYCEKSFERRAALSTHLLNCRAKQEALAKPAPTVKRLKANASTDDATDEPEESATAAEAEVSFDNMDNTDVNEMFAELAENNERYSAGLHTVSLDTLQLKREHDSSSEEAGSNSEDEPDEAEQDEQACNENGDESKPKLKKKRNVPIEKQLRCRCKICNKQFNALGNLRRHISMFHYRARRFGCTICDYRAFRRYDIVNHLGFTHKIEGDRETLNEKYVATHECEYSRDDVDGDIVLMDKEKKPEPELSTETKPAQKTYEKRVKRIKTNSDATVLEAAPCSPVDAKEEPEEEEPLPLPLPVVPSKKRRKSRAQISPESGERSAEKRPIRKRTKAVNKDFVYDMVSFKGDPNAAHSANPAVESMRARLRRPGNVSSTDDSRTKYWQSFIADDKKSKVQGITRRLMLKLVSQGRAVSATLPELPAERPQIRPRLISYTRSSDCEQEQQQQTQQKKRKHEHVVDTSQTNKVGESILDKIAKRTAAAASGKEAATISNLWQKVNRAIEQPTPEAKEQLEAAEDAATAVAVAAAETLHKTPNGKHIAGSAGGQLTPPLPPRKDPAAVVEANTSICSDAAPAPTPCLPSTTKPECLSSMASPMTATTSALFPALPKPPSVLQASANGTIQFTLDSLLRAALQN